MKKIATITALLAAPFVLNAQELYQLPGGITMTHQFFDIPCMILVLYLIIMFILSVVRALLDNRLKSQMINKGVSDKLVEQFLQPTATDAKDQAMKWFLILFGIGLGLTIVSNTLPLGIHSISIMTFSLSLSFLGYYFFVRQKGK